MICKVFILQDPRYEIQRIQRLVIRDKMAAVVNDDKLKTLVSLAVAGCIISHNPEAAGCLGPFPGTTPYHAVEEPLTTLCTCAQVSVSVVNQYLDFGVVQKLCNVGHHGYGSILLQIELTVSLAMFLLEPAPSRAWNTATPNYAFGSVDSLLHSRVVVEEVAGTLTRSRILIMRVNGNIGLIALFEKEHTRLTFH